MLPLSTNGPSSLADPSPLQHNHRMQPVFDLMRRGNKVSSPIIIDSAQPGAQNLEKSRVYLRDRAENGRLHSFQEFARVRRLRDSMEDCGVRARPRMVALYAIFVALSRGAHPQDTARMDGVGENATCDSKENVLSTLQ